MYNWVSSSPHSVMGCYIIPCTIGYQVHVGPILWWDVTSYMYMYMYMYHVQLGIQVALILHVWWDVTSYHVQLGIKYPPFYDGMLHHTMYNWVSSSPPFCDGMLYHTMYNWVSSTCRPHSMMGCYIIHVHVPCTIGYTSSPHSTCMMGCYIIPCTIGYQISPILWWDITSYHVQSNIPHSMMGCYIIPSLWWNVIHLFM